MKINLIFLSSFQSFSVKNIKKTLVLQSHSWMAEHKHPHIRTLKHAYINTKRTHTQRERIMVSALLVYISLMILSLTVSAATEKEKNKKNMEI